MFLFNVLQLLGGLIVSLSYLPQMRQILRTKSVKDFNLNSFIFLTIGLMCMETYGIYLLLTKSIIMFLLTNSLGLIVTIGMIMLILWYRGEKNGKEKK